MSTKTSAPTARRVLDAAEAQFAARGYHATSLAEVADAVSIRGPSLYKHFASKRDLYVAVLERLLDPYFELLEHLLRAPANADQADANLAAVLAHYAAHPNIARLLQHAALTGGGEVELLIERWIEPFLARAVELTADLPVLATGDPRAAAHMVIAFHTMMSGYITLAPIHARLLGGDPLEPDALATHAELLRRMARNLWKD